jgi:hypothetical protein
VHDSLKLFRSRKGSDYPFYFSTDTIVT